MSEDVRTVDLFRWLSAFAAAIIIAVGGKCKGTQLEALSTAVVLLLIVL